MISSNKKGAGAPFFIYQTPFQSAPDTSCIERLCDLFVRLFHTQTDTTLTIDLEHFDFHDIAFSQLIAHVLYTLLADLRDVDQAVLAREDGDECAEIHQARNPPFVDAADFDVRRNQFDATARFPPGKRAVSCGQPARPLQPRVLVR